MAPTPDRPKIKHGRCMNLLPKTDLLRQLEHSTVCARRIFGQNFILINSDQF